MTVPVLKVEMAFGYDPYDTAPVWTNVTSYVRRAPGVKVDRKLGQAGTISMTLSNRDRRFDPTHTAGPYYGYLKRGVQVRVTCTHSATTWTLGEGWVKGWPQQLGTPSTKDSAVQIEAVDALGWMARTRLPDDLVYTVANSLGTLTGFLRETDDLAWLDSTTGDNDATLIIGTRKSGPTLAPGCASPSIGFNGTTIYGVDEWVPSGDWSLAFWMTCQTNKDARSDVIASFGRGSYLGSSSSGIPGAGTNQVRITVNTDGRLELYRSTNTGFTTEAQYVTDVVVGDGQPHHIVVTGVAEYSDGSGVHSDVVVYVDGNPRLLTDTSDPGYSYWLPKLVTIGSWTFNGSLQDIAWYDSQLTAANVTALYNYSRGYVEEAIATRATRYLDDGNWPSAWRDISTTMRATCGRLVYNSRTLVDALQELDRTEQGRTFASKDRKIKLLGRYFSIENSRSATSQATFSDDGSDVPYHTLSFKWDDGDGVVLNDVTVTAAGVGRGRAKDQTSIDAIGPAAKVIDTVLTSQQEAAGMAACTVALNGVPVVRTDPILVLPERRPACWPTVLALELADRVTFQATPMGVGSQTSKEMLLSQITWQAGDEWSLVVAGEPITTGWFTVGSSLVDGPDIVGY